MPVSASFEGIMTGSGIHVGRTVRQHLVIPSKPALMGPIRHDSTETCMHTFWRRRGLAGERRFLKCPPLEIFLVAPAFHLTFVTLFTRRLGLVAFQSLCLASHTT